MTIAQSKRELWGSVSSPSKHEVFLNYRCEDTKTFVGYLDAAMTQNGIPTFKDDEENSNLFCTEIEESRLFIVIFSKSYGSSSRCLDELVKIMDCSKKNGQLVLPVYYYDFNPSDLRKHGPVFGELFAKTKYDMDKVRAWTSALVEAANLPGIGLIDYRYEAAYIKEIVETVLSKLNINKLYVNPNAMEKKHDTSGDTTSNLEQPIGIDRRVQRVKELLQVRFWPPGFRSVPNFADLAKTVENLSNPQQFVEPTYKPPAWLSPRSSQRAYDVFMCFEGNGTCKDFADQLHCALEERKIYACRNAQEVAMLKSISKSQHLKAIDESNSAIVVFSKTFASSAWCLDELVKIMDCNEGIGQSVFPVFYDVDPSDVRYQKGPFGEAFIPNNPEKVDIWKKALAKVGCLAGWYLNCTPKSDEAAIIKSIVDVISRRLDGLSVDVISRSLDRMSLSVDDKLIGIEAQIKHVTSLLKLESDSVETIAICGMGGIGKTTIARAVFDQVSTCFETSYFFENIREVSKYHGLQHIEREMLSKLSKTEKLHVGSNNGGVVPIRQEIVDQKVLVVLDDVDDSNQLEALLGSCRWFGQGSRIIITTRDETLLVAHNVVQTYYVKPLDDNESYQFLRKHAFRKDDSTKAYEDLFPQVVSYAAGLPLALKVLSSLLCGRSKKEWESILDRIEVFSEKAIQDTLKISYESLNTAEKEMFLDISCFFNDTKMDYVVNILDSRGFSGNTGIRTLEQKSLICISNGHIKMHRLIQQMGRDIVRQMHPDEPEKRSRLWQAEELYGALMDSESMKEVEAIVVDDMHDCDYEHDFIDMTEAFRSMENLTLLQIHCHNILRCLEGINYFPKSLCWLTLENYPLPSLPSTFEGNELVGLELPRSRISEPWNGIKFMWNLRFLDFSYSRMLIKTPDFTGTPNLKEVNLEYCTRLAEVHDSIGRLQMLDVLNFRNCYKLETLPRSILKLRSLRLIDVSGCVNLKHPMFWDYLLEFNSNSQMMKVPGSVNILSNLVELDLSSFRNLRISSLPGLKFGFKLQGRLTTLLDMVVNKIENIHEAKLSTGEASDELVEVEKENIHLLAEKGV